MADPCRCSFCKSNELRREVVGGWVLREDHRLPWNRGMSDPDVKLCVCGEIGHARWLLYVVASREAARRHLDTLLDEMAKRVGVEYDSSHRRRETSHKAQSAGNTELWR